MNSEEILAADGPLTAIIHGYAPRDGQIAMALSVERAMADGRTLVCEAGTGIGKTFAYLIPALTAGLRVIVSTGTRNLQDQIFHSDIPRLRDALGLGERVELLKGRGNYLCLHRMEQANPRGEDEARRLSAVRLWSTQTQSGDLAEMPTLAEQDSLRPQLTSTGENCLGNQCDHYEDCFVARARGRAQDAALIVVNHHLLCADLALKDDGFGEILPAADAIIIDEAHQFPDVLAQFFGFGVSARQCRDLGRDVVAAAQAFGDALPVRDAAAALGDSLQALQSALPLSRQRMEQADVLAEPAFTDALDEFQAQLTELERQLKDHAPRGPEMASAWRRAGLLLARVQRWADTSRDALVRWAERQVSGFALQAIPLDIAPAMQTARERQPGAWIMTSATLSVGGDFRHFTGRLGLDDAETLTIASPFDYAKHARLLLPPDLPEPAHSGYPDAFLALGQRLIEAADGGCFWLCTSQRMVDHYAQGLEQWGRFTVLAQGRVPRNQLLEQFRADGRAVLVGTSSFWEGVDVRGRALRLVLIDRLPFAVPDDPVVRARAAQLEAQGRSVFVEHQLPQAVLSLKQGAGRLIRDPDDRGVLVIGDRRLQSKGYGRQFLASLPPMQLSRDPAEVCAFLQAMPA